jgi:DNA mismatch endonuclease (patch repair protein)
VVDVLSKTKRSRLMAAIRSSGNRDTELRLIAILRAYGVTGWRRNQKIVGKPDFVFQKSRLAVFVEGCFWHGCGAHCRMPKSRQDFWFPKIAKNKARDNEVAKQLRRVRWRQIRFWERELHNAAGVIARQQAALASGRQVG